VGIPFLDSAEIARLVRGVVAVCCPVCAQQTMLLPLLVVACNAAFGVIPTSKKR